MIEYLLNNLNPQENLNQTFMIIKIIIWKMIRLEMN